MGRNYVGQTFNLDWNLIDRYVSLGTPHLLSGDPVVGGYEGIYFSLMLDMKSVSDFYPNVLVFCVLQTFNFMDITVQ